jgi:hypothetical protein
MTTPPGPVTVHGPEVLRLAAHGCRRLKVSNDLGIYLRAGFGPDPAATAPVWTRPAAG